MASSKGAALTVAGISYYAHPQALGTVLHGNKRSTDTKPEPTVVISADNVTQAEDIISRIWNFAKHDDVYSEEFGKSLVLQTVAGSGNLRIIQDLQLSKKFTAIHTLEVDSSEDLLPSGPYFLQNGCIHQAWRLYVDELNAFVLTVIPNDVRSCTSFSVLDAIAADGIHKVVAVPSRLYATRSKIQPLAGMRFALKDCFNLAGVKTTMSSRAYTQVYGPEKESAAFASKLLSLGASIVGKTKMTNFASSDEPTDQWVDDICPINPRGDGYQSPSGSSSGAAAALAGYSWLDQSIGADTGGSIRAPATANGVFSLRPSWNITSMDGIGAIYPDFDVVGILARDLQSIHDIVSLTHDVDDAAKFPSKILYPEDFFPHSNRKQQAMVDTFVTVLEKFLGVKAIRTSLAERWRQCPPLEAGDHSITEYLAQGLLLALDDKASSNLPLSCIPAYSFARGIGEAVSQEDFYKGRAEIQVFRQWFDANVLSSDPDTKSDAIMIMPYGMGGPKYRDAPNR
ncbi:MAG: hypothetical protein Q9191_001333 [Dirinaria sp. TL-2023a]